MPVQLDEYGIPIKSAAPQNAAVDEFGILVKKKSGGNTNGSNSTTTSTAQSSPFADTINKYNTEHQNDKPNPSNLGVDIGMKPIDTEAIKAQHQKAITKAAENTFNKTIGKGAYTKLDSAAYVNQLKEGVNNGSLGIVKDASGNDVIKNTGNFFQSFKAAADEAHAQSIEDKYLRGVSKGEAISYLNRLQQHPETGIVKESDIAPTGLGNLLGSQAGILGKATIGGMLGAETGATGGASAGSFVGIVKDIANSGYSQALKKNYNILKQQGLNDNDAFDKATKAALVGEAVSLGTGALLSGEIKVLPKPTISTEGFVNSLKHTALSSPKVLGSTAAGAVANDITTNAIANGNPIDTKQMISDAEESVKPMAVMHFALGGLAAIANGQKSIVPSYARPQMENIVASADRGEVQNYLQTQETNGSLPQGTTQKVLGTLERFDEKKAIVAPFRISEENKAAIAGKLIQKDALLKQKSALKPNENALPQRRAEIDKQIAGIDGEINKLYGAKNPYEKETDAITGESSTQPKAFDELKPQEQSGIIVPKEYGTSEVVQNGEGENKIFVPKANYIERNGALEIKKNIPIESESFTDRNKAQAVADNALKQHYYENELHDNAKPDKKIETQTQTEIPNKQGDETSQSTEQPSNESSAKQEDVGEVVQSQQSRENIPNEVGNNDNLGENKQENIPSTSEKPIQSNSIVESKDFGIDNNGQVVDSRLFERMKTYDANGGLKIIVSSEKSSREAVSRLKKLNETLNDEELKGTIEYLESKLKLFDLLPEIKDKTETEMNRIIQEHRDSPIRGNNFSEKITNAFADLKAARYKLSEQMLKSNHAIHAGFKIVDSIKDDVNRTADLLYEKYKGVKNIKEISDKSLQQKQLAAPTENPKSNSIVEDKQGNTKSELSSNKEPDLPEGRTPVTLSGSTEQERQSAIQQREKETKQTPMTFNRDALLERINKFNKLDRRQKRGAYTEANKIKLAVDEFNKTHDQQHSIRTDKNGNLELRNNPTDKRPSGSPIKHTLKGGERSVVDKGVPLMERDANTKKVFQDLLDADVLPVARRVGGEVMPEAEHEATIQDIMDGIPSQRAENYLNSLEKQIKNDDFDYGNSDKTHATTLKDALGIQSENNGEPMSAKDVQDWLSKDSEITPEDETTLDNIDNLITYYEQQHEFPENAVGAKVSESSRKGEEISGSKTEQNEPTQAETKQNSQPLNTEQNAVQKQSPSSILQHTQEGVGETGSGRGRVESIEQRNEAAGTQEEEKVIVNKDKEPPLEPPTEFEDLVHIEHPQAVFTHRGLQEGATEFGLEDVSSRDRKSDIQFKKDVENKIAEWKESGDYSKNIDALLEDAQLGKANELEQGILEQHQANLYEKARKIRKEKGIFSPEYEKVFNELDRFTKVGKGLRSEAGANLRQKTFGSVPDESLEGYLLREKDSHNGAELTEKQKTDAQEGWQKLNDAKLEFEKYKEEVLADIAKANAEKEFQAKKAATKKVAKKSHEDFVKERKDAVAAAKEALKKLRTGESGLSAVPLPGVRELIAIAPHVSKALGSLLEEGAIKLADAVKLLHEDFKDVLEGLTEQNIHDIIAGEYNEKKGTRNEAIARKRDLQTQAALINRLEKLQNGEVPKTEKLKQERNSEIAELQKKIGEHDISKLETLRKRNEATLKKVNDKLEAGDFEPEKAKASILLDDELRKRNPELYKKALESRDKLIKQRKEVEVRRLKNQVAKQPKILTVGNKIANVANVPRAIMSSMDFSAPLRQGLWGVTSELTRLPIGENAGFKSQKMLANQFAFMFKAAASQKFFDRWFFDIAESPRFHLSEETKLAITDPHDPVLSAHEEAYMTNLVERIPLVGKTLIKGSERAYVMFLNKMRWDMFNSMIDAYERNGKTYQNSAELYKATAKYVNAATGRGDMGKALNSAAPILNATFFSPRLIASRVGMLTHTLTYALPSVEKTASLFKAGEKPLLPYNDIPKEIRVQHYKDLARFVGLIGTIVGSAALYSHVTNDKDVSVETDPRSSDFMKIKNGNTRFDLWGGFLQYGVLASRLFAGQSKSSNTGQVQELNGQGLFGKTRADLLSGFVRGKTSPTVSMMWDYAAGRTIDGQPATLNKELTDHLFPLLYSDVKDAYKDRGVSGLFETLPLSMFGVGIQTYLPRGYDNIDLSNPVYKTLYRSNLNLNAPEQYTIKHEDGSVVSEREYKSFIEKREKYFQNEAKEVIENGTYVNDKGEPTSDEEKAAIDDKGEDIKVPFDKLTQQQKIDIIKILSGNATRNTKKEMFTSQN